MPAACVLLKYVAESAWCLLLFGQQAPRTRAPLKSLAYGFVRLLIGREAMLALNALPRLETGEFVLYFVLIAGRWLVWGFLLFVRRRGRGAGTPASNASGMILRGRTWQVGGVVVSCLADIPALLSGLWVGQLWL